MIEVLSKPAEQISAGDIQSLIDSEVPEGEQIEFKEDTTSQRREPSIHGCVAKEPNRRPSEK